jgi:hypothetical protein
MTHKFQNFMILIGSILIGIPLGIVVGLICWFKFPFQIYWQARANLAKNRIQAAEEQLREYETGDIWEKHIERMQEKKSYDN